MKGGMVGKEKTAGDGSSLSVRVRAVDAASADIAETVEGLEIQQKVTDVLRECGERGNRGSAAMLGEWWCPFDDGQSMLAEVETDWASVPALHG